MFEDNDAPNAGGTDAVGSLPAAPPIPQPVPSAQPPTKPAEAPALPVSPAAPSRSFMSALAHSLIGSTMAVTARGIKAVAGPPAPDSYSTDATGKMTPNFRRDDTRSRLERLAQHALEGLAAGAQIG